MITNLTQTLWGLALFCGASTLAVLGVFVLASTVICVVKLIGKELRSDE